MKEIFALISFFLVITGLIWYSIETRNKKTKPNLLVLFAFLGVVMINTITYYLLVQDVFKTLPLLAGVVANIILLVITIKSKEYLFLRRDSWVFGIAIIFILILIFVFSVKDIHIIMQIISTIPFVPLLIGIAKSGGKEPFYPWLLILISSVFGLTAILVAYSDYWSLINPLRAIVCQSTVLIFIRIYKNKK